MKYLLCFFTTFIAISDSKAQARVKPDFALESKVMDLILFLPEVRQADAYVIKHSHHKRRLQVYINECPEKKGGDYRVMVAEDNGYTYHTHFIFLVNSKTLTIKYSDVVTGEDMPLEVLRKNKKRHEVLEYN
jgi:hypothetical protein